MPEDLDEETIDALSSETRREILKLLKGHEKNPTFIAREVGKHKSTIAEHLDILREAGLVEKNDVPGRRRVSYSLTRKGRRSISSSRLRLTFMVSILSLAGGIVSLLLGVQQRMSSASFKAAQATAEFEGGAGATAGAVDGLSRTAEPLFYPLGATLLVLGLLGLFYWSGRGR